MSFSSCDCDARSKKERTGISDLHPPMMNRGVSEESLRESRQRAHRTSLVVFNENFKDPISKRFYADSRRKGGTKKRLSRIPRKLVLEW